MDHHFIQTLRATAGITDEALNVCAKSAYDLLRVGHLSGALTVARGLVAADHRNSYYRVLLATALIRTGDLEAARKVISDGLAFDPENVGLLRLQPSLERPSPRETAARPQPVLRDFHVPSRA